MCCWSTPNMEQRTVGIGRLTRKLPATSVTLSDGPRQRTRSRYPRRSPVMLVMASLPMEVHSEQGCDVISRLSAYQRSLYRAEHDRLRSDNLPGGPLMVEALLYISALRFALALLPVLPRDDIHWSMTGDNQKLYRWRWRAATYANWPDLGVRYAARQHRFRCAADYR